eukprot:UN01636
MMYYLNQTNIVHSWITNIPTIYALPFFLHLFDLCLYYLCSFSSKIPQLSLLFFFLKIPPCSTTCYHIVIDNPKVSFSIACSSNSLTLIFPSKKNQNKFPF